MPEQYNIPAHRRGDTWQGMTLTLQTAPGVAYDLTGCTIRMQLKTNPAAATPALHLDTTERIQIADPEAGELLFPPQIVNIPAAIYHYDLEITHQNGTILTALEGTWEIKTDVTR